MVLYGYRQFYCSCQKLMIFIKTSQKILKQGLVLQIASLTELYQKEKNKTVIGLIKDELGGKIMKKFVGFKAKTYIYLRDYGSKDKKCKRQNKVCHEKKTCI